ncbi:MULTISPECIES: hypothetical protein [Clostridium]|uniref:Cysteine-rich CPCC n=1 Tax=Clostridium frigoriphilum TaxID=443253 RepID=A0ABU7UQ27_9CLOT|nr:hypothetical protein [Clostridium sp. DSM 17811]MBU3100645.1 hypothetical protein [Clostridium sp. DSM 17811]
MKEKNINYGELEQHEYDDAKGNIFYTCPLCGGEYLDTFITEENSQKMCVDCWNEKYGD